MSINFPEEQFAMLDAVKQYLLQHQTEIDRIWKRMTPESDWSPGNPNSMLPDIMGRPGNNNGGGNQVALVKVGITNFQAFKGYFVDVTVQDWNGTTYANTSTVVNCYLPCFNVDAGKRVVIGKDFDSTTWFVISREC